MTSERTVTRALTCCLWTTSVLTASVMAAIQSTSTPNPNPNPSPTAATTPTSQQDRQSADFCVPEAWQGGRASTLAVVRKSGESTVKRTFGNVIYSARRQKMVIDDNIYDPRAQYTRRIFDYPARVLYTVRGGLNQTCQKTPLPGPWKPQCVPGDSAVTIVNATFGVGGNQVPVFELSGVQNKVNYRVSLTYDTHVPVYEQLWGGTTGGAQFMETLSFYNVTIFKEIPAVMFQPPAVCQNASLSARQVSGRSTADDIQRPLLLIP